jgi:hypothetical protein
MKYILTILLSLVIFYTNAQKQLSDSCFTKKQVLDISFTLDSLYYVDSINNAIIQEYKSVIHDFKIYNKLDSTIIAEKDIQIRSLRSINSMYIAERIEYNKWYNKRTFWFGLGVATTTILVKIISGM